jgi:hypothetical protein
VRDATSEPQLENLFRLAHSAEDGARPLTPGAPGVFDEYQARYIKQLETEVDFLAGKTPSCSSA